MIVSLRFGTESARCSPTYRCLSAMPSPGTGAASEALRSTFAGRHWSTFDPSLLEADFIELVAGDQRLREAYEDLPKGQARLHHYWETRWQ
jgi:hypothetical protein